MIEKVDLGMLPRLHKIHQYTSTMVFMSLQSLDVVQARYLAMHMEDMPCVATGVDPIFTSSSSDGDESFEGF